MPDSTFYLTTAIFYPSPKPALHSMFEAIGADMIARYHRLLGEEVRFLTGVDEHSVNVERDARAQGIDPHELIDPWAATWQATFERFSSCWATRRSRVRSAIWVSKSMMRLPS